MAYVLETNNPYFPKPKKLEIIKITKTQIRQCAYFDPRGRVVSTMPEHLNPMNKEDDGNR